MEREMMVGTEGLPDYLVVSNPENLALGFKPIMAPSSGGFFVGWRVRLCNPGNSDTAPLDVDEVLSHSSLGVLGWTARTAVRASMVVGAIVSHKLLTEGDAAGFSKFMEESKIVVKLIEECKKNFSLSHPEEDIAEFTVDKLLSEFSNMKESYTKMLGDISKLNQPVGGPVDPYQLN